MKIRKVKNPGLEFAGEDPTKDPFERHFEQHWASIYHLLKRMVGDPAEAEDLALEAMYRLYKRESWLPAGANIGGWLYRVATNLGLHSIRSHRRRENYETAGGRLVEFSEDRPQELAAIEEERRMARQVLAQMNARQSQLLMLRYSGMAYKDIAAALDISPTSIGPLLVRAEREFERRYRNLTREDT